MHCKKRKPNKLIAKPTRSQTKSQKTREELNNPAGFSSSLLYPHIPSVITKQLPCTCDFKSSCGNRFELGRKRLLEVPGKLGRQQIPYGEPQGVCTEHLFPWLFSPSNLTGFVLAFPLELCILSFHLCRADQALVPSSCGELWMLRKA